MSTFNTRSTFDTEVVIDEAQRVVAAAGPDDRHAALREIGSRAHQLQASTRAADHFNAGDTTEDHSTGSWLISGALALARELASDLDMLARALRDEGTDNALSSKVAALRTRAYQVQAAARAADHFLDQDTPDDRETGSWLIATAHGLARKLAAEIDDSVVPLRRPVFDKAQVTPHDAEFSRRLAAATVPPR